MTESPKKTELDTVREWINSEGYPLEYRTAIALHNAGFYVQMGMDLPCASGKSRDIDVIADLETESPKGIILIRLLVECKRAKTPWCLLQFRSLHKGADDLRLLPCNFRIQMSRDSIQNFKDDFINTFFFSPTIPRSHLLAELSDSKNKATKKRSYEATSKLVDVASNITNYSNPDIPVIPSVCIPLIVIDGCGLYTGKFNSTTNTIDTAPVEYGATIAGIDGRRSIVYLAHDRSFSSLANSLHDSAQSLANAILKAGVDLS